MDNKMMDKVSGAESIVITQQQQLTPPPSWDQRATTTPHRRHPSEDALIIPSDSDQPIDMSLSSRKRALSPSKDKESSDPDPPRPPAEKKTRITVTEVEKVKQRRKPLRSLTANHKKSRTALIISPEEYSDEGINNHFRRSLSKYYSNTAKQMGFTERDVDGHFLRSLGWDTWWSIHRQAKIQKPLQDSPIRAHTPEGKDSGTTPPL